MVIRLIHSKKELFYLKEFTNNVNSELPKKVLYNHINLTADRYTDSLGQVRYLFEKGIFSESRERALWKTRKYLNMKNRIKALYPSWSDKKVQTKINELKKAHGEYRLTKKELKKELHRIKNKNSIDYQQKYLEIENLDNPFSKFFSP